MCYKPTTTVLATINTTDFLYTCDTHLTDTGFATPVHSDSGDDAKKEPALSAEEIAKVKKEWEDHQKLKEEKEVAAKEKKKAEGGQEVEDESKPAKKVTTVPGTWMPPPPPTPTHQRFVLHRNIFLLRQSDNRRKRQAAQAKSLAPRLPGAPRGDLA